MAFNTTNENRRTIKKMETNIGMTLVGLVGTITTRKQRKKLREMN
jgi:hypothetical protein